MKAGGNMQITPSIHRIGSFINQYLLIDNNDLTLIDTGMRSNKNSILKYIKKLGYPPSVIKRILITHSDPDHYGAAKDLKDTTGSEIWATKLEAEAMEKSSSSREITPTGFVKVLFSILAPVMQVPAVTTERILVDGETLPILGGIKVIASPGHTPGHVSFFFSEERILIAGDAIEEKNGKPVANTSKLTADPGTAVDTFHILMDLHPLVIGCGHAYFDYRNK
jgi:glyoxylase-like metal-dependent hydrolase (beta-lactamase superfamily II)